MHADFKQPLPIRLKNIISNAFLYCTGYVYATFARWAGSALLDDDSPLAKILDQYAAWYEEAGHWEFDYYILITTIFIWALFNSIRQARQLKNISSFWLLIMLIISTMNGYGIFLSALESTNAKLTWKVLSLLWSQTAMVKLCILQSYILHLILIGLALWVPVHSAIALIERLFQGIQKV